jgi:hypothetical protein
MMLVRLLEAALRFFALGGAVWLSLRFLRVRAPQTRMTARTVVLMASLSMLVLMHWATVPIPAYSSPPDVVIASPAAIARRTAQPTEFPLEQIDSPSAAEAQAQPGTLKNQYSRTRYSVRSIPLASFQSPH